MLTDYYEFDFSDVKNVDLTDKKIAVQLPPGLKNHWKELKNLINRNVNAQLYFYNSDCYGACDVIPLSDVDAILQIGHERMGNVRYPQPVYFIKLYLKEKDFLKFDRIINELKNDGIKKIGLVYTVTYEKFFSKVYKRLIDNGIEVIVDSGDLRVNKKTALVLGCNFSAINNIIDCIDGILFVGDGIFHPLPLIFKTDKPVYSYDPVSGNYANLQDEKKENIKKRYIMIKRGFSVKEWGIVVSIKAGQNRLWLAKSLKKMAEKKGVNADLLLVNYLNPDDFKWIKFDGFVSTACSRVAIDDAEKYTLPILTPQEFMIVLGFRNIKDYRFDEMW
ncbi:MAG: diphthamide biosynthesis enzyme Dph2 [Candidatus Thermoplasmatota archaeon]|jgi:2-(3-amino-3-carboxypropyl)histidine synthase|nr:diphthamide biosynthesis enzyme Dph2 [Candidatus Thermoplasmatota archaeon]MCL5963009.1 diphthamide biosynthesis enzyme Dph2 [Candidatus Thermoplasmatota archaeon]